MKKWKSLVGVVVAAFFTLTSLTGCGNTTETSSNNNEGVSQVSSTEEENSSNYKIGIIQLVEHNALDAAREGFIDGLKEAGYEAGKNITLDYQNAQGDQSNCPTIASKLVNDKNDLILAIATPAAQAVANATKEIPVLVTAITDPADAKLVASNEAPGANVSGTSDLTPVKEQITLIKQVLPEAKKVGLLYCSSEANSKFQIELAKESCKAEGLETVEATVSNSNEIQQVVQSLVGKVDAMYIPTDNMLANGMSTVIQVTTPAKIPVFAGEEGMVENGGLMTYGIDYYELGKLTAKQAIDILENGKSTADMPIGYCTEFTFKVNEEAAKAMDITIPQALLDQAK